MLIQYVLDNCITSVLPSYLIVGCQLARFASPRAPRLLLSAPPIPRPPRPIRHFTLSTEKQRKCPNSAQFWCNLSPLDATLLSPLLTVANKELAQYISTLNATLAKNMGGGAPRFMPFLTSLLHYIFASFLPSLQYNRCAFIRGRNEFQPAFRRDTNRLRAPLLGRQCHRTLRASLLLRRVRFVGPLPSRSPQLPDGPPHEFDRPLSRPGMVPGYLRGSHRRPARLSPWSLARLLGPPRLVALAWLGRLLVDHPA